MSTLDTVVRTVTEELVASGAEAVVLVGSHARGEASAESDLDLLAVGDESYFPRLEVRGGFLVSSSMHTFAGHRDLLGRPEKVCGAVPGWRDAVIIHDPEGFAASLVEAARSWKWESLGKRCGEWVAEEVAGYAEEVHKLVGAFGSGNFPTAAAQRSLIALHLAPILAVHHRILYGSENRMWDLVSDAMGEEWTKAQSAALGVNGETLRETCLAASKMYRLAAEEVRGSLDGRQRRVVENAVATAEKLSG